MKMCGKCKETKSFDEFYRYTRSKDGYQAACKECSKAFRREWFHKTEKGKAYGARNREQLRQRDPEYFNRYYKKYYATEEGKARYYEAVRKRRALELGAEGSFTKDEFIAVCDAYNNMCLCCKAVDVPLEADHIIPLSKGGVNDISNIQPLCRSCNARKSVKDTDYRFSFEF